MKPRKMTAQGMMRSDLSRLSATHGAADALVRPATTQRLTISRTGKGTTSVVPYRATKDAALAAEGEPSRPVAGSRFLI